MSIEKERGGAERIDTPSPKNPVVTKPTKWWTSTNFFISAILFIAGFWGLNSAEFDATVKQAVMLVYEIVGVAGALRVYLVNAKLSVGQWLSNPNAYQYLVAALTGIVANLPADADDQLFALVQALKTGNIGIIVSAAVTFAVFVWNVWSSQPKKQTA